MNTEPTGKLLHVNGAMIYHEVQGSGPSVLFIAGATGDSGHFQQVGKLLSDEFTVVTYDRRANLRSPRPDGWESTSTEEQSEDAARLIEALVLPPSCARCIGSPLILSANRFQLRGSTFVNTAVTQHPLRNLRLKGKTRTLVTP